MSCFDNVETESLDHCLNREPPSGISEVGVYYALHGQAINIPMPIGVGDAGYNYEKAVEVTANITFQAGKGFSKMRVQPDTGEVKIELVGNLGNKKVKQSFDFFVPRTDKKTLGYLVTHMKTPQIFMVQDKDGTNRQIGDKYSPAYIDAGAATTGKTGEDERGIAFTIVSYGVPIAYEGTIQEYVPGDVEPPAGG